MMNNYLPIGGKLNIQLNTVRAYLDCFGESRQRVLRRKAGRAAMRDDRGSRIFGFHRGLLCRSPTPTTSTRHWRRKSRPDRHCP